MIVVLSGNDVNLEVFRTMTEDDLREIGITSFGVRRQLKLAIANLQEPAKQTHANDEHVSVCVCLHWKICQFE